MFDILAGAEDKSLPTVIVYSDRATLAFNVGTSSERLELPHDPVVTSRSPRRCPRRASPCSLLTQPDQSRPQRAREPRQPGDTKDFSWGVTLSPMSR